MSSTRKFKTHGRASDWFIQQDSEGHTLIQHWVLQNNASTHFQLEIWVRPTKSSHAVHCDPILWAFRWAQCYHSVLRAQYLLRPSLSISERNKCAAPSLSAQKARMRRYSHRYQPSSATHMLASKRWQHSCISSLRFSIIMCALKIAFMWGPACLEAR